MERLPLPEWAGSVDAELTDPEGAAAHFAPLAPERVAELIVRVKDATVNVLLSPDLPTFSSILDQAIDQVFRIDNLEDRFAVCLYFLKDDTLGYRQNEVMVDLLGVVRQLMKPERHMDVERILSRLTRFFRARDNQFLLMRFQCYEAIGVAIGEAGNVAAADHLIEDVLSWRFQYPDIQGATDDWETVVNPYHLPKIRCWMHIIESNPALYERLAAALNVQLRLGGVYIADTDLFQRDVTRFLNADIRPIYFVAKQLLRAFPVYFNDVGAEGELRSVSTEIDEICGRRDTLTHFLRKQSHAESSNRLVAFSRAVLYLLDHPGSLPGLSPICRPTLMAAVRRERESAEEPHAVLLALWAALPEPEGRRRRRQRQLPSPADRRRGIAPPSPRPSWSRPDRPGELLAAASRDRRRVGSPGSGRRVGGTSWPAPTSCLAQKYSLSADNVGLAVSHHLQLDARTRLRFTRSSGCLAGEARHAATRDRLLDMALAVLQELQAIVLSPAPVSRCGEHLSEASHRGRIPSMYGTYNEPKFDALGLSFRVENLVARLLEDLVSEGVVPT